MGVLRSQCADRGEPNVGHQRIRTDIVCEVDEANLGPIVDWPAF